jgi:uncharacterized membrane protein
MNFCRNCGAPVEGQFCGKCGASMVAPGGVAPGGQVPPPPPPPATSGLTDNVASALCYLAGFITGIIFLVLAPYNQNKTVRFHAFQSIFLNVAVIVVGIALSVLSAIMFAISFTLGSLISLLHLVFGLAVFLVWLYMMWKAYQNEKVVLPIIGPLAEKQA